MIHILEKYSKAFGVSGHEEDIRRRIEESVRDHVDSLSTDFMGNLYAHKPCGRKNAPHLLLVAHMDEVGLLINGVESNGMLRFVPVGGVDPRLLVSKRVILGKERVPGVIGAKPIHIQSRDEWKSPIPLSGLYIDIGASDEKEAAAKVPPGTAGTFHTFFEAQEDVVFGKAFDDRAGCALITELLMTEEDESYPVDITAVFTVQEEVGLRGASLLAERVRPDFVIAFEGTTAGDVPRDDYASPSTEMRKGPAISFMDRTAIGSPRLIEHLKKTAEKNKIPFQMKKTVSGGTDIGVIHTKGGIPSVVVSVPVRYIHAPRGILAVEDYKNTIRLAKAALMNFKEVL